MSLTKATNAFLASNIIVFSIGIFTLPISITLAAGIMSISLAMSLLASFMLSSSERLTDGVTELERLRRKYLNLNRCMVFHQRLHDIHTYWLDKGGRVGLIVSGIFMFKVLDTYLQYGSVTLTLIGNYWVQLTLYMIGYTLLYYLVVIIAVTLSTRYTIFINRKKIEKDIVIRQLQQRTDKVATLTPRD